MGAAMFIMHVDRHFPIWTTYSCSFRQTCPQKKSEKIPYTDIFLWISMVELCRGVWMFVVKTYIISACTGGKHRSPYLCINLFAAMLGTSMRKTPSSPTTGVRQAVRKALADGDPIGGWSVQFHWRSLNGFLFKVFMKVLFGCFTFQVVQDFFHSKVSEYQQTPKTLPSRDKDGCTSYSIPMVFSWGSRMEFLGMEKPINTTIKGLYRDFPYKYVGRGTSNYPLILWKR